MKNQKGFSALGILLVIVVLGLVGGTGWYVWGNKQSGTNNQITNQTNTQNKENDTTDPYAGWKTANSSSAKFTLRYPSDWSYRESTNNGGAETLYVTSPNNFQIEVLSFTRDSGYGQSSFGSNPTGECGATCLGENLTETFSATGYGALTLSIQKRGAGGGSINTLSLYNPDNSSYIQSPKDNDVYSTFLALFQGKAEAGQEALPLFATNQDVLIAKKILGSLQYY